MIWTVMFGRCIMSTTCNAPDRRFVQDRPQLQWIRPVKEFLSLCSSPDALLDFGVRGGRQHAFHHGATIGFGLEQAGDEQRLVVVDGPCLGLEADVGGVLAGELPLIWARPALTVRTAGDVEQVGPNR